MAKTTDWMPGPRAEILAMCENWIDYMTSERRTAWGVPPDEYTSLKNLCASARTLLQKASDPDERTRVITFRVREAFQTLESKMRFFRGRYFRIPPLTGGDWAALGFRRKRSRSSPIPPPDGTPLVSLSYPGDPRTIMAHLGPMPGTEELDSRSGHGYAVYGGIMPPGGATLEEAASKKHYLMEVPKDGDGLTHYRFTRWRKTRLVFDAEDGGKTLFVCARYENGKGETGNWGPVASLIIPG
ncbi:MAG: hypothetical protein LBH35_09380 [Treponema sp.]|jgi:hypothetical protein|nr:hypothetical protein [Treponema sp.]